MEDDLIMYLGLVFVIPLIVIGGALFLVLSIWAVFFVGNQLNSAQEWYCEAKGGEIVWLEHRFVDEHYQECDKPQ